MTLPWRIAIIDDERSVRSGLSNLRSRKGMRPTRLIRQRCF